MRPLQSFANKTTLNIMIDDLAIRIAERDGLCSVSSNTKWQRSMPMLESVQCRKRFKFINIAEPTEWRIEMWYRQPCYIEISGGPVELKFVEWMEIERCERRRMGRLVKCSFLDHSDEIRHSLVEARLTFQETEDSFVIFGYTRGAG